MRRGSTRYDNYLDSTSASENESSSQSEIDLLNPRKLKKSSVRGGGGSEQFPRLFVNSATSSSLDLDARYRRKFNFTKLPPKYSHCGKICRNLHNTQQEIIFEESEKLGKNSGINCTDGNYRRKTRGTPRIIRAIRHNSEKLNVKDRSERSLIEDLKKDSSKSSVVVLYHGENKKSADTSSISSSKPPIRISKSEKTLVTLALPSLGIFNNCHDEKLETVESVSDLQTKNTERKILLSPVINSPSLRETEKNLARRKLTRKRESLRERRRESLNENNRAPRVRRRRRSSEKSTRSNWDIEIGERRYAREQCGEIDCQPRSSRLMAHRSTSPKEDPRYPQIAFLMQHMQNQQKSGQVVNNNSEPEETNKRVFPFQSTASGNLKIIPNQVVFESKKVSVLVADPRHTKVNVKAELGRSENNVRPEAVTDPGVEDESNDFISRQQRVTGITEFSSRADQLINEEKFPIVEPEYVPRTQPHRSSQNNRPREMEQNQVAQTAPHRLPLPATEVPLSSLGFTGEQPIDWENIILPEKTDLYRELARRITNYKNADCIVRLGHDEFHCHLLVLQSYSNYFDEKNCKEVDLTGSSVTSKAFGIIYDWMISPTNDSCHLLRRDNILEIFMAAQQLGIKELEEQCWAFIDNDELFTEDTAFLLYLEARKIGNTAVMELMVPRIMKFFLMLVSTKDFLELSVDELCLLLRSNYICVNSEMEVLMSAVRWLMHDWQSRRQYMMQVLKCVRFGLIAPWQLVDVKRNPENPEFMELMSYPEVQKMVDDGLAFVIIKYWYGNQTEDYYHWIDLLGLTEPTNRNWAGEDKNYVTYREFLLYLEEYQRTKMPELKCRKSPGGKVNPANGAASSNSPSHSPAAPRLKANSQANNASHESTAPPGGAHLGPLLLAASNNLGRTPGKYSRMAGSGAASQANPSGAMPMPPELLGRYLSSFDRNANKHNTTPRNSEDRRLAEISGESPKRVQYDREERKWQTNTEICGASKNPSRKVEKRNFQNDGREYRDEDSSRSEEDAATTIQAIYRGYKARRKFGEIRKSCSEERQNAKKVAELLAMNATDNLHKPLEPVRISASSASHNKEANNLTKISRRSPSPRKKRINSSIEERTSSSKDLEGIRFDVVKTKALPESYHNDAGKSIQTIHRPCNFQNFDEKTSSISDNTDTDADPFSPRLVEKRSRSEIRCRNPREVGFGDNGNVNCQRHLSLRMSESIIGGNGANDYYGKDSLFFAEREAIVVFGGLDPYQEYGNTGNTAKDMYRLKPLENEWEFVGEIPEPRHHHSIAFLKGRVYLVGGADPRDDNLERKDLVVGTVWSYDPTTRVWYREPGMLTPRKDFGLVVSGGKMYAIGGQDKNGIALRSVEAFDPSECMWQEMRPMCYARVGAATAKYRELIWVGGGMTKSKKEPLTKEVECYDPLCNLWVRGEPLRFPRCYASMYVVSDCLYVIGGATKSCSSNNSSYDMTDSIESVDVWDPTSKIWRHHGEIGIARHGHGIASIGNQLIIVGGLTNVYMKSLKSVERYCCQSAKSIKGIASLPYPLSGHDCLSLPPANFFTSL